MTRNKKQILEQYKREKEFAYKSRQTKLAHWLQNEELYNGVLQKTLLTRSNLHIPKVFEGVQEMSSRLGDFPDVDYTTKPEGDDNAPEIMKHLFMYDLERSRMNRLWQLAKIEAGIYGVAIFKLIPSNDSTKFALIDPMSFLIAPIANTAYNAPYVGQQFIYKTKYQLDKEAEEYGYDKGEVKKAQAAASETNANITSEGSARNLRYAYQGFDLPNQLGVKAIETTEWYTHIDGEPYVLTVANDQFLLRAMPLSEVGLDRFPFTSAAIYPRLTSFWVPSVADIYRDPNLAADVLTNQMIDNNTYRNFGMLFVDSSSGIKQGSITPRPLGVVPIATNGKSIRDTVFPNIPPEISDAAGLSASITSTADKASGLGLALLSGRSGGKMSASQMQLEVALLEQRISTAKENFMDMGREMAQMYADFASKHQTGRRDVKIFGYKEVTIKGVNKDNFKDISFIARAIPKETNQNNKALRQKAIIQLYQLFKDDPKIPGQEYLRKLLAKEFSLTPTEINKLLTQESPQQQPPQGQPQGQPPQPTSPGQPGQPTNPQNPNPDMSPPVNPQNSAMQQVAHSGLA